MVSQSRVDGLIETLRAAAEELADLAIDELAEAVREGQATRPETERRMTRARAAIDKAVGLLESLGRAAD